MVSANTEKPRLKNFARLLTVLVASSAAGCLVLAQTTPKSAELQQRLEMHATQFRTHDYAQPLTASDAVIVSSAEGQRSAFTPGHAFIYSDWDFRVLDVLKNDSSVAAKLGDLITVARPGGTIRQDGVKYVAHDKTFPDFVLGGTYVLFLRQLAESHSFLAFTGGCPDIRLYHFDVERFSEPFRHSSACSVSRRAGVEGRNHRHYT
jgi:hypothetical protein